jgi:26S proteasome non-ATPase regulatory subunit 9
MSKRAYALSLISQKEGLEAELQTQYDILKSHSATMSTPLVDTEGFPRADIDIWAVRHARVRVIELRNDISAIVERIKGALEEAAAEDASAIAAPTTNDTRNVNGITNGVNAYSEPRPFGKVNGVAPNSPASTAVRSDVVTCSGGYRDMTATNHSPIIGPAKGRPDHPLWSFDVQRLCGFIAASGRSCLRVRKRKGV